MRDESTEFKLMRLIESDHYNSIKKLFDVNHELNVIDINRKIAGMPLIISAVQYCRTETVQLFVQYPGININATDEEGRNAAYWAAMSNNPDLLPLLIQHGAQLFSPLRDTHPPILIAAVEWGCIQNIMTLIKNDINFSAKDQSNVIALNHAISHVRWAQQENQEHEATLEKIREANTENNPNQADFFAALKRAQSNLSYRMRVLGLLLINGAAIGRDVTQLLTLHNISFDGCYFMASTIDQHPISNALPGFENALITFEQLDQLCPRAPIHQLLLRCSEVLSEYDSEPINQLRRLLLSRTRGLSLQVLCLEQLSRDSSIAEPLIEEIAIRKMRLDPLQQSENFPLRRIVPIGSNTRLTALNNDQLVRLLTLSECSQYGSVYRREYSICENRLRELSEITERLEGSNNDYFIRNCRISAGFFLASTLSGFIAFVFASIMSLSSFSVCGFRINPNCTILGRCIDELTNILSNNETSRPLPGDQISECRMTFINTVVFAGLCFIFFLGYHGVQIYRAEQKDKVPKRLIELRERIAREDRNATGLHLLQHNPDPATYGNEYWSQLRQQYHNHMQEMAATHPYRYEHRFFQRHFPSSNQQNNVQPDLPLDIIDEAEESNLDVELAPLFTHSSLPK